MIKYFPEIRPNCTKGTQLSSESAWTKCKIIHYYADVRGKLPQPKKNVWTQHFMIWNIIMKSFILRIIYYQYYYSNFSYAFNTSSPGNWTTDILVINTWLLIHWGKGLKSFYFNEWAPFIAQKKKVLTGINILNMVLRSIRRSWHYHHYLHTKQDNKWPETLSILYHWSLPVIWM